MAVRRQSEPIVNKSGRPPATTPEERENQLISAAVDLAEQQILNGTASAQVLTHYLKLGSSREKLEQLKLKNETELLITKKEMLDSEKRVEALIGEALEAMRAYSGHSPTNDEPEYDEYEE